MQQKIFNFIKYNNTFTIILGVIFLGGSVTFAASPTARESVYSSQATVVSVDNRLIVSTDLDNFNFNLRISSVTEDNKNYYAAYSYETMVIENGFWQIKEIDKTLTVSKEDLGGKDLGLYVAKELGDNIKYELSYLKRTQQLEKEKGETPKIIATEYSGLVGKMLNPKEEIIEGYNPVIPKPVSQTAAAVVSQPTAIIVSKPVFEVQQNATIPSTVSYSTEVSTTTGEVVNEQLIQEVVQQELLQSSVSSDSASSSQETPNPEPIAQPTDNPTSTEPAQ
jgi:hypothetical protein